MSKLYCAKINDKAILPSKRQADAGYDIYALFDKPLMVHDSHTVEMFPTGIKTAFVTTHVALLRERGSTGTKGMEQRAGVIEGNYRGQWFVPITNGTNKPIFYIDQANFTQGHFEAVVKYFTGDEGLSSGEFMDNSYHFKNDHFTIRIDIVDDVMKNVEISTHDFIDKFTIYPQTKAISQAILIKKEDWEVEEITEEELMAIESDRGEGALGSSGK